MLVALGTAAIAAPSKDPYVALRGPIARIVGGAYDGAALVQLTELTEKVGGRVTGTKAYGQAVIWAQAQLKAAGAQNVHVENFTIPHGWQRGTARLPRVRARFSCRWLPP